MLDPPGDAIGGEGESKGEEFEVLTREIGSQASANRKKLRSGHWEASEMGSGAALQDRCILVLFGFLLHCISVYHFAFALVRACVSSLGFLFTTASRCLSCQFHRQWSVEHSSSQELGACRAWM